MWLSIRSPETKNQVYCAYNSKTDMINSKINACCGGFVRCAVQCGSAGSVRCVAVIDDVD
ncbi:hypothetical protein BDA96_10G124200 [Sorghum bicolor]|uniref:Uncharacterized protein n=2 Tax=Sorghum bicolor TaxID=4558 RepID=A0A921Q135_SORBI|nr:hypothetical protein BDA96_10G124200 [Sorghum bicolor]OQU76162.1 hypothetical protein SORBI_3010G101950 [Sorghum bicolor]